MLFMMPLHACREVIGTWPHGDPVATIWVLGLARRTHGRTMQALEVSVFMDSLVQALAV